jgi:GWxTD domain-containing protein
MRKGMIAAVLLAVSLAVLAQERAIEWINSPEAYFATASERAAWFRLKDDAEREAFKKRYWLIRDPTPDTPRNEFMEVILDRIRKADAKFSIQDGAAGSETAQGLVYIVLGPPAIARTRPGGGVLAPTVVGGVVIPNTMTEATDVVVTWIYDTHRTPHLLEMLGRPELQITIVIEPTRRRDVLQTPGLFDQYRELLAKRSIVNPQANTWIAPANTDIASTRLNASLPDAARILLRNARPIARSAEGVVFNAAELWTTRGSSAVVSFSVPNAEERTAHLTTYGEVRTGDRVIATIAQPFVTTDAVVAAAGSRSEVLRLDLPPGAYEASFALVDDRNNQPLLAVTAPLRVLDPTAGFDVSSLLLSGEPMKAKTAFTLGEVAVQPRADLLFRPSESIWYFALIRSASGAKGITVDIQLRRDGKPVAARSFTPSMDQIAPAIFLFGQEVPGGQITTGEYSLYLLVHGEKGSIEVRRADFRVGL